MVESLKDLERLLKLCRKQGVTEITTPAIALKLGDLPVKHPNQSVEDQDDDVFQTYLEAPLTNEELTVLANGGETN